MPLTPAQRKTLKSRAHALQPVVLIGGNGLSPAVLNEIDLSLRAHELIKIHVAGEDREVRALLMDEICASLGADPVQSIGRMLVLFREKPPAGAPKPRSPARRTRRRLTKRTFQEGE
ncbi:MAG: YhbY family RNA-binding protein [Betaproteobacteria bacterium]|jgi:putative YhbY family RNA-binding protein